RNIVLQRDFAPTYKANGFLARLENCKFLLRGADLRCTLSPWGILSRTIAEDFQCGIQLRILAAPKRPPVERRNDVGLDAFSFQTNVAPGSVFDNWQCHTVPMANAEGT